MWYITQSECIYLSIASCWHAVRFFADKSVNLSLMCSIAIPNDPSILNFLSNLFNSGFCKSISRNVERGWREKTIKMKWNKNRNCDAYFWNIKRWRRRYVDSGLERASEREHYKTDSFSCQLSSKSLLACGNLVFMPLIRCFDKNWCWYRSSWNARALVQLNSDCFPFQFPIRIATPKFRYRNNIERENIQNSSKVSIK